MCKIPSNKLNKTWKLFPKHSIVLSISRWAIGSPQISWPCIHNTCIHWSTIFNLKNSNNYFFNTQLYYQLFSRWAIGSPQSSWPCIPVNLSAGPSTGVKTTPIRPTSLCAPNCPTSPHRISTLLRYCYNYQVNFKKKSSSPFFILDVPFSLLAIWRYHKRIIK